MTRDKPGQQQVQAASASCQCQRFPGYHKWISHHASSPGSSFRVGGGPGVAIARDARVDELSSRLPAVLLNHPIARSD